MGQMIVLGAIHDHRRPRWYFWFLGLGFTFSAPFFAGVANMNLDATAAAWVFGRFFLLSHVLLAPLMALGIAGAAEAIAARTRGISVRATEAVAAAVVLIAIGGAVARYATMDQSNNHVARRLAEDVFMTVEPGSILLAAGDEVDLPLLYLQTVEGHRRDVTLILMPLLTADWYVRQLRERYPNLVLPFARHDGKSGTMKAFIDANRQRTIAVIGKLPDNTPEGSYWLYRYGLVAVVEPMAKDVTLPEMIADNERLLARYRPPSPSAIRPQTFERAVLTLYAIAPYMVGQDCEKLQSYAEARVWYQRAAAQDPNLTLAREALDRIAQR